MTRNTESVQGKEGEELGLAPSECKQITDVLSLNASAFHTSRYWMQVAHDGALTIAEQIAGEPPLGIVTINRTAFQRFLNWYNAKQSGTNTAMHAQPQRRR